MLLSKNELNILGEFAKDYHKKIYGRDVAKRLKMNQKTVSNTLNRLEKEDILRFKSEGKNKYYYLNEFYPYLKEVVYLIEVQRKIDFFERYRGLKELFARLEERSKGILVIFGSYASLTSNKDSDLDVFLIGNINDVEDLEELYGIKINIIRSTKSKFDKKEYIVKEIVGNHIILKGIEDFVGLIW